MPSACGLACEVCGLREQGFCPIDGCVPGTDAAAKEKLEKFTVAVGHPCFILECAIRNQVDHCTRCPEFPCEIHYQQGLYSEKLLDMIRSMRGKE